MRTLPVLALLLALPVFAQENEAESVYRQMDKKVAAAKTLRVAFSLSVEIDGKEDKIKGTIYLDEGNKAKIDVDGTAQGKPLEMLMVSDGEQMVVRVTGQPEQAPRPTPASMGTIIRGTLGRAGAFAGIFLNVPTREEPKLDALFQAHDFKLGGVEKEGSRELQILEHQMTFRGAKEPGLITVWVNRKTLLPAKRVFTINEGGRKVVVNEAYGEFVTDVQLDAKLFELPK